MSRGILDTRDLQERLDELESELASLQEYVTEAEETAAAEEEQTDGTLQELADARTALQEFEESDDYEELEELRSMSEEIFEWRHGEALIPVDEWEDYVQELLSDIGDLPRDIPGYIVIDWEATAANIAQDYSTIDYQGETYYYRNY